MTRAAALTNAQQSDVPEPSPYAEGGEFGALPSAETPAQELVPVPDLPVTPLHIVVKDLLLREEARDTHVRILSEENDTLKRELKALRADKEASQEKRDRLYTALLARVQEIGDWVDAPAWKPGETG